MASTIISSDDKKLIEELRQKVEKHLPLCPQFEHDVSLLRWLIGWDRKIDVIVPKLIFSIRACHALGLDKLSIKTAEDIYTSHEIYQNEAIQCIPGKILGFDKNGHPIFISAFGKCDFGEYLKCMKLSDLYLYNLVNTYGMLEMIRHKELELGKKLGNVCIVDLEGMGYNQLASLGKCGSAPQLTQEMFPDLIVKIYIINAPSFIQILAKMMVSILAEQTRQKIHILGHDYKEVLARELGEDVLYEKWGGKRNNKEDINLTEARKAVPKSLHYQKANDMDPEKLKKLTISHGKTEFVPIKLEGRVPGRKLYWWWKLDSGTVAFSVMRGSEEKLNPEDHMCWPRFELHTELVPEWNEITAEEPGIYKILFGNDSYIWSRTVRYFFEVKNDSLL